MADVIKLFQYNTLNALFAGLFDGSLTIGELLKHGDLGIGTLDSIDGELVVLDGKAYQTTRTASSRLLKWIQIPRFPMQRLFPTMQKLSLNSAMKQQIKNWKKELNPTTMGPISFVPLKLRAISSTCTSV